MKASEFASYFDFNIVREDHLDEENFWKRFIVTDSQGVMETRHISYVDGLADCFNSLLDDYVNDNLKESGFALDPKSRKSYYSQALSFLKGKAEYKRLYDVINCLLHPEKIKDDVTPKGMGRFSLNPKVFLTSFFKREIPENVIREVEKREGMDISKVIENISTLPEFEFKDFNDPYTTEIDLREHTQYLEMTVENVHELVTRSKEQKEAA